MKTLKETIRAMQNFGMSQEAISEVAGVSQMTISRWSRKNPRLVNLGALTKMQKHLEDVKNGKI